MHIDKDFNLSDNYMGKMGDAFFEAEYKPLLKMYVDMAAIYDYRLTALMALIKTQRELDYIHHRLTAYKEYKGRKITTCFPALKFKEEQLDEFLTDPKNIGQLSKTSIVTNMINIVPAKLLFLQTYNRSSPLYNGEPITLQFSNPYFLPIKEVMDHLAKGLRGLEPNMTVKFSKKNIIEEDPSVLKSYDIFVVDDLQKFTEEGSTTYKMLFQDKAFLGKMIHACNRLDDNEPWMSDEGKERLNVVEKQLVPFTFLQFVDKQIIAPNKNKEM